MPWLLGGYMWLYLHRPFEFWPVLGTIQLERLYMIGVLIYWMVQPGKLWVPNRLHTAFVFFTIVLIGCWLNSPYPQEPGQKIVEDTFKVGVFFVLLLSTI